MPNYNIPIYQPDLTGNERKYVDECLETTWISSKGRFVNEFESHFAREINITHATAVSNGTVALHLALLALDIRPGDEVIVPTLTYIASVNAVTYTGATPIFADSLADTWQIDPEDIIRKINSRTRAIMVVHLYGQSCEMDKIKDIATKHGLYIIEDCAEAFGTLYKGRHVGSFGDISTFSFFGNKTITTGEGGMVVTANETLIERVRHFKGQGLAFNREYWHDVVGYNYRMTNIQAAIGLAQLERSKGFINRKRSIANLYSDLLRNMPLELHREARETQHSFWMVSILVKQSEIRDPLRQHLARSGIETRPLFFPVHTMPIYLSGSECYPVAEDLASRGINLPSYPGLSDQQIHSICDEIINFFKS